MEIIGTIVYFFGQYVLIPSGVIFLALLLKNYSWIKRRRWLEKHLPPMICYTIDHNRKMVGYTALSSHRRAQEDFGIRESGRVGRVKLSLINRGPTQQFSYDVAIMRIEHFDEINGIIEATGGVLYDAGNFQIPRFTDDTALEDILATAGMDRTSHPDTDWDTIDLLTGDRSLQLTGDRS